MASTIWKGQLAFGLDSFPVRLQKAARRERIALKYVKETRADSAGRNPEPVEQEDEPQEPRETVFLPVRPTPPRPPKHRVK